ncbi:hypothetical protein Hanom_Chr12g01103031 [Helianthus anomalus]
MIDLCLKMAPFGEPSHLVLLRLKLVQLYLLVVSLIKRLSIMYAIFTKLTAVVAPGANKIAGTVQVLRWLH